MMEVPWDQGADYFGGWIVYILLLLPTFVFNVVTFFLITHSPRLNQSSTSLLVRYLALEDAVFAFCCLVQCSLNLHQGRMEGDLSACEWQAAYVIFFCLSTGYTLCCIAYNSEQRIGFKPGLTNRAVFYIHLLIWAWSALITVLSCYVLAPARLVPSGLYCTAALDRIEPLLLVLAAGPFIISPFLLHRYVLMYRHIQRHNSQALSAWEQHRLSAQAQQMKVAKRMLYIISVYQACYLPDLILSIWEVHNGSAPPAALIATGLLVHLNSFLNPVLYVYCNSNMRQALWETFVRRVSRNRVAPNPMSLVSQPKSPITSPVRSLQMRSPTAAGVAASEVGLSVVTVHPYPDMVHSKLGEGEEESSSWPISPKAPSKLPPLRLSTAVVTEAIREHSDTADTLPPPPLVDTLTTP